MKFRLLCLILALAMLLPAVLTGCADGNANTSEEDKGNVADKASETTVSLRMYMITERHVPTQDEVDAVKAEKGDTSKEYIEIKAVKDAYADVAKELDKITKAKFRTHLDVVFYTIDEYRAVEEIMEFQAKADEIKKEAKEALKKFQAEQVAFGYTDEADIKNRFYEKYPQYAAYTDAETADSTVETEIETITNEYGITELKYPELGEKQVDIVCVSGYDNYLKYIEKGWLNEGTGRELEGSSTIVSYVNEKFLSVAEANIKKTIFAIPNNKPIGEYTYLLLHKDLYSEFQGDYEEVTSLSDIVSYLKDVSDKAEYKDLYVPITGDLDLVNTFFWSLDYEYTPYKDGAKISKQSELDPEKRYYTRHLVSGQGANAKYSYRMISLEPLLGCSYYTVSGVTEFNGTTFDSSKVYYTKDADGGYSVATEYVEGTKYYNLNFLNVKLPNSSDRDPGQFKAATQYYTKNADNTYSRVYNFVSNEVYYTVESASLDRDTFSLLGGSYDLLAGQGTEIKSTLLNSEDYKAQAAVIKEIKNANYYVDSKDLGDKKFAAAVIKGGADLDAQYGDEYHFITLEYPRADARELCENMIGISSSTTELKRAMQIVTYLNTNSDFRNLMQYGIEGVNYKVVNVEYDGKTYPTVQRLNNYYQMDIYKTGNTFVAYPEEGMDFRIWEYGKKQNSEALYDPMNGFEINDYVNMIDFSTVDYMKELSASYEARIEACATSDELEALFEAMRTELSKNTVYSKETLAGVVQNSGSAEAAPLNGNYNPFGVYHNYVMWWTPLYYGG